MPGTGSYVFPGMIWGSAFSTPGVMNRCWEPSDFPMSDRPVLNYGKSCLFTLSYEGRNIVYSNHWGSDPTWGIPPGPTFNCTSDYMSDQELNLKAYVRHNMHSERTTLLVGDGNMSFATYMWQIGLDIAFPDMKTLIAPQKPVGSKLVKWLGSMGEITSIYLHL